MREDGFVVMSTVSEITYILVLQELGRFYMPQCNGCGYFMNICK
jgi:hypothetical protein